MVGLEAEFYPRLHRPQGEGEVEGGEGVNAPGGVVEGGIFDIVEAA